MSASLILASASKSRATVLRNAGVSFIQLPSAVDENAVKNALRTGAASAADCANKLAELKAIEISAKNPAAYVVGCDQMLDCAGRWYDKPTDIAAARRQLQELRGLRHQLFNGMVVARAGVCVWRHSDVATLEMRNFSDAFLDDYFAQVGDHALWSVGGYQIEGLGSQLFSAITGDFFSILGLPLLPLLAFLREHGAIDS